MKTFASASAETFFRIEIDQMGVCAQCSEPVKLWRCGPVRLPRSGVRWAHVASAYWLCCDEHDRPPMSHECTATRCIGSWLKPIYLIDPTHASEGPTHARIDGRDVFISRGGLPVDEAEALKMLRLSFGEGQTLDAWTIRHEAQFTVATRR